MAKYRDIILEALARANLNPRKKDPQPDMLQAGSNLLKGIFQEFSGSNLLTAYQSEVNFTPANESVIIGDGLDAEHAAPKIQCPTMVLFQNVNSVDWSPLNFVSYNQFYSIGYNDYTVSWQPIGPNLWKIYFKPRFLATARNVKVIYNVEIDFNDDDQINMPTPYVELLTRALAYKLAVAFPRVDATKMNLLKNELDTLQAQLESANSSQKIITRDTGNFGSLLSNFDSGRFIY